MNQIFYYHKRADFYLLKNLYYSIQIQLITNFHMSYIPSNQERIKVYDKLRNLDSQQDENNFNFLNSPFKSTVSSGKPAYTKTKCVSKEDLDCIVDRLSRATKRDYVIKQQVQNLQSINKEKRKRQADGQRVENRLIKAGRQLENKIEEMREQEKKRQGSVIQDKPKISSKAKQKIDKPFLERMEEAVMSKEQQLARLKKQSDSSFNPQLNPYSLFMAEVKNRKRFIERVGQFEEQRVKALKQKEKEKQRRELESATFQPQINQKSKEIGISRINTSMSKSKTNKNSKSERQFIPEINKKSSQLADRRNSSNAQFHERLYADMRKPSTKKLEIRKEMDIENTFKPKMNKNSKKIIERVKQCSDRFKEDYEEIKFVIEDSQTQGEDQPLFEPNQQDTVPSDFYEQVVFEKWKPSNEMKTKKENKAIQLLSLKLIR